jgi:hypothetical protein
MHIYSHAHRHRKTHTYRQTDPHKIAHEARGGGLGRGQYLTERAFLPQLIHGGVSCGGGGRSCRRRSGGGGGGLGRLFNIGVVFLCVLPGAAEEHESGVLGGTDRLPQLCPLLAVEEPLGVTLTVDMEEKLADDGFLRFGARFASPDESFYFSCQARRRSNRGQWDHLIRRTTLVTAVDISWTYGAGISWLDLTLLERTKHVCTAR